MNWPIPPLQNPGSYDCEKFAAAYISRLLGFNTKWELVRDWAEEVKKPVDLYPYFVHGIKPKWSWWSNAAEEPKGDPDVNKYVKMYSRSPNFKEFVFDYLNRGCVGYTSIFLVEHIGHAVVLLEADEEGVLFSDSARGLVKDSWDNFINPLGKEHRFVSRIQTWYEVR